MKLTRWLIAALFCCIPSLQAQPQSPSTTEAFAQAGYNLSEIGANRRVWSRASLTTNQLGQTVVRTNRVVELAAGMYRQVNGEWIEAAPELVDTGNGIIGQGARHTAEFPANLNGQGTAVRISMPGEQPLEFRVFGLAYEDSATGTNVLIAELKDVAAQLIGSNTVAYVDATTDFRCTIRYNYTKSGVSQELILNTQPPLPEALGLNPATTRLVILSELVSGTAPQIGERSRHVGDEIIRDDTLDFASMRMIPGRAFRLHAGADRRQGAPVARQFELLGGRGFVTERVRYEEIRDDLFKLPWPDLVATNALGTNASLRGLNRWFAQGTLPPTSKRVESRAAAAGARSPELRSSSQTSTPKPVSLPRTVGLARGPKGTEGFLVDWDLVYSYDENFECDKTYLISSETHINDAYFEPGVEVRYDWHASLYIDGSLNCMDVSDCGGDYVLLASINDRQHGSADLSWLSSHPGSYLYGPALVVDPGDYDIALLHVRDMGGNPSIITSDAALPSVSVTSEDPLATKGVSDEASFTLTRTAGDWSQPLTVNFTLGGTARSDTDYQPVSQSATIHAHRGKVVVRIQPAATSDSDSVYESTVTLNISASNLGTYYVASPEAVTVYIIDPAVTAPPPFEVPSGLISWWSAESSPDDAMGNNSGNLLNNAAYGPGRVGNNAFEFDGDRSVVTLGDPENLKLTTAFTIESWLNLADLTGTFEMIFMRGDARGGLDPYYLAINPSGALRLHVEDNAGTNGGVNLETPSALPLGQWVHVAGTFDSVSGSMQLYVNGDLAAQGTTTLQPFRDLDPNASPAVGIGNLSSGNYDMGFNGWIDEISVYERALAPDEIQGIYDAGRSGKTVDSGTLVIGNRPGNDVLNGIHPMDMQPPSCVNTPANLVSSWQGENNAQDALGINPGTPGGTSFAGGKVGTAFSLDGGSQYVDVPTATGLNPTAAITVEAWVYVPVNYNPGWPPVIKKAGEGMGTSHGYSLEFCYNSTYPAFWLYVTNQYGADWHGSSASSALPTGQWSHIAGVYDGTYISIYVNGSLAGTSSAPGTIVPSGNHLQIGHDSSNARYFKGLIDEASVYSSTISAAAIQSIYNAQSGGKCLAPNIVTQPSNLTVCQGEDASFNVTATGLGPLTYQWIFSGTNISGATASSYTCHNVQTGNAGTYMVAVSGPAGVAYSSFAMLTVKNLPSITVQPADQVVAQGGTAIFDVTASDSGPITYEWYGAREPGEVLSTASTLTLTDVQTSDAGNYQAAVFGDCSGGLGSRLANLTVVVPPTITGGPTNQTVIQGSNATFSVSTTGNFLGYQWKFNGTPIACATNSSYTITNVQSTNAGAYAVAVTNLAGTIDSTNATLTVIVPPSIIAGPTSLSVTQGNNATFTVNAGGSPRYYQWKFYGSVIPGATASSYTRTNVQPADNGQYAVTITNMGGSVTSSIATLTVIIPPPSITGQPASLAVCEGLSGGFSVTVAGTNLVSYQWTFNSNNISGETASSYTFSYALLANAGNYAVVVTGDGGSVTSSYATLTVYGQPWIFSQPANQTVAQGSNATFSVGVSGTPPFAYQWMHDGNNIPGATAGTLNLFGVQPNDSGGYSVRATNGCGMVTSSAANLIILPSISIQPASRTVNQGTNVNFTVTASGTTPLSYQWKFYDTAISGATASSYTRTNVQSTDAGPYTVTVTNAGGSVTSSIATLTVIVPPTITGGPTNQTAIQGSNVTFGVNTTGIFLSYQWKSNNVPIPGATNSSYTRINVQPADDGSYYWVTVANTAGSVDSTNATLTVIVPPSIIAGPTSLSVTQGNNATFTVNAIGNPLNYQWKFNNGTIAGATASSYTRTNVQPADNGQYAVTITNLGGSVTSSIATLTVIIPPPSITGQPVSQTVCEGLSPTFSVTVAGTNLVSYQWTFNSNNISGATASSYTCNSALPGNAGNYAVVVTGEGGSIISSNATLTVNSTPSIASQPVDQTVAQGSNATFSVGVSGTPPFAYQWMHDGNDISGATIGMLSLTSVQPNDSGAYSVRVTNGCGTVTSRGANLIILPSISIPPVSRTANQGSNVNFTVTASGTSPLSYQWKLSDQTISGATASSYTRTNVQSTDAGPYTVIVANAGGSVTSSIATLTVVVPPTITGGPTNQTAIQGSNATFSVNTTGIFLSYQWKSNTVPIPGATNSSYTITNVQPADAAPNYSVTVTNAARSVDSTNATLTVIVPPTIMGGPTNQTAIQGSNATFSVNAGGNPLNYQWKTNNVAISGATNSSYTITNVQPADGAPHYSVTVTNAARNVNSTNATLTVIVPPTITGGSSVNPSVNQGSTANFYVNASGSPLYYQWKFNTVPIAGATTSSYNKANVQPTNAGSYFVDVTNIAGTASRMYYLTVNPLPTIIGGPTSQTATQGGTATFSVSASYAQQYQWKFNGASIPSATSSSYSKTNIQTTNAGNYSVTVINTVGSVNSTNATLTVLVPPNITAGPVSQTACQGNNTTFKVTASGTGPLSYQWSLNGASISSATNSAYVKNNIQTEDAGTYTATVTNLAGSVTSTGAVLTVVPPASCVNVASNLVASWSGEGNANDLLGTHNGVLTNGATFQAGKVGQAFLLNGSNACVSVPDDSAWAFGSNDFTIELWANFQSLRQGSPANPEAIFAGQDQGGGTYGNKWCFDLAGGNLSFQVFSDALGSQTLGGYPFEAGLSVWHHLAVVRSGTNLTIYADATALGSAPINFAIPNFAAPLTLGQAGGLGYINGLLDEVSIYSRALSPADINAIYSAGPNGKCTIDSDGDGLSDLLEGLLGTNPNSMDSDGDGLNDGVEYYTYHTNPANRDTDGDGVSDGDEVIQGRNPLIGGTLPDNGTINLQVFTPTKP